MSKYIIVSKNAPGNKIGERYIIEYQVVDFGYAIFKTTLICLKLDTNGVRYCWMENEIGPHLETSEDREEFLNEFYEFQKGGSYRKLHPIIKASKDDLIIQKNALKEQLAQLERQIQLEENLELTDKLKTYFDDVDLVALNEYLITLANAVNNRRYYLKPLAHVFTGSAFIVYDRTLDKPVKRIKITKQGLEIYDLEKDDIRNT